MEQTEPPAVAGGAAACAAAVAFCLQINDIVEPDGGLLNSAGLATPGCTVQH